MRTQAAEEITKALQEDGDYKILFVLTLESGRVKPDDLATITLVLRAIKQVPNVHYAIIVNKLSKPLVEKLKDPAVKETLVDAMLQPLLAEGNPTTNHIFFLESFPEVHDQDNKTIEISDYFQEFLYECPGIRIRKEKVEKLDSEKFTESFNTISGHTAEFKVLVSTYDNAFESNLKEIQKDVQQKQQEKQQQQQQQEQHQPQQELQQQQQLPEVKLPFTRAQVPGTRGLFMRLTARGSRWNFTSTSNESSSDLTVDKMQNAVESSDLGIIESILRKGFHVNTPLDARGYTALHFACATGNTEVAIFLINFIALNRNDWVPNAKGETPLHCAAKKGALEIVLLLLKKGHPMNSLTSDDQNHALHYLVRHSWSSNLKLILEQFYEKNSNINYVNSQWETPLHCVLLSKDENVPLLKWLLEHNAIETCSFYRYFPHTIALVKGFNKSAQLLWDNRKMPTISYTASVSICTKLNKILRRVHKCAVNGKPSKKDRSISNSITELITEDISSVILESDAFTWARTPQVQNYVEKLHSFVNDRKSNGIVLSTTGNIAIAIRFKVNTVSSLGTQFISFFPCSSTNVYILCVTYHFVKELRALSELFENFLQITKKSKTNKNIPPAAETTTTTTTTTVTTTTTTNTTSTTTTTTTTTTSTPQSQSSLPTLPSSTPSSPNATITPRKQRNTIPPSTGNITPRTARNTPPLPMTPSPSSPPSLPNAKINTPAPIIPDEEVMMAIIIGETKNLLNLKSSELLDVTCGLFEPTVLWKLLVSKYKTMPAYTEKIIDTMKSFCMQEGWNFPSKLCTEILKFKDEFKLESLEIGNSLKRQFPVFSETFLCCFPTEDTSIPHIMLFTLPVEVIADQITYIDFSYYQRIPKRELLLYLKYEKDKSKWMSIHEFDTWSNKIAQWINLLFRCAPSEKHKDIYEKLVTLSKILYERRVINSFCGLASALGIHISKSIEDSLASAVVNEAKQLISLMIENLSKLHATMRSSPVYIPPMALTQKTLLNIKQCTKIEHVAFGLNKEMNIFLKHQNASIFKELKPVEPFHTFWTALPSFHFG